MRQLEINPQGHLQQVANHPNFGILTTVENLARYDMIYIYHHMNVGDEITLRRDHENHFDEHCVEVFFKGFKLGTLSTKSNKIVARLLDKQKTVKAKVRSLYRQKFMPLDSLEIEVRAVV